MTNFGTKKDPAGARTTRDNSGGLSADFFVKTTTCNSRFACYNIPMPNLSPADAEARGIIQSIIESTPRVTLTADDYRAARTDDAKRARVAEQHYDIFLTTAIKYAGRGMPLEDLFQTLVAEVMAALPKYDPDYVKDGSPQPAKFTSWVWARLEEAAVRATIKDRPVHRGIHASKAEARNDTPPPLVTGLDDNLIGSLSNIPDVAGETPTERALRRMVRICQLTYLEALALQYVIVDQCDIDEAACRIYGQAPTSQQVASVRRAKRTAQDKLRGAASYFGITRESAEREEENR